MSHSKTSCFTFVLIGSYNERDGTLQSKTTCFTVMVIGVMTDRRQQRSPLGLHCCFNKAHEQRMRMQYR